jgi:alpha galactosidase C-like protein
VILLGTFAGQANEANPVAKHPLGEILAKWAGLTLPKLKGPALVELREMTGEKGRFVFLFNHADKAAQVDFAEGLEKPATSVREIVSGETQNVEGIRFRVTVEVPAHAVRIYRIDY